MSRAYSRSFAVSNGDAAATAAADGTTDVSFATGTREPSKHSDNSDCSYQLDANNHATDSDQ